MHLDARGRRPAAIWQAGDDHARARSAGDVEAGSSGGEDGEANSLVDDGRGDCEEGAVLPRLGGRGGGLAVGVGGGRLDGLGGLRVRIDAVLCGNLSASISAHGLVLSVLDLLQKFFRILAALSHSLSIVLGRNVSDPSLFASMLKGAAALVPNEEKRWAQFVFLGAPSLSRGGG